MNSENEVFLSNEFGINKVHLSGELINSLEYVEPESMFLGLKDNRPIFISKRGNIYIVDEKNRQKKIASLDIPIDYYLMEFNLCLLYTSPSPRDRTRSRMPSSA